MYYVLCFTAEVAVVIFNKSNILVELGRELTISLSLLEDRTIKEEYRCHSKFKVCFSCIALNSWHGDGTGHSLKLVMRKEQIQESLSSFLSHVSMTPWSI